MFDDLKHSAIAAIGAVILTVTAVGAAVGPARAVETTPAAYAQLQVADQANG